MGRSLSFASIACDMRPIQTRFRFGSVPETLSQATHHNSPVHYAKGTPSPVDHPKVAHRASTNCKYMVSGTFNSPYRGTFHLSLALLCTIGRDVVLSLGGWAPQLHAKFHGLDATLVHLGRFAMSHTGLSPCIV